MAVIQNQQYKCPCGSMDFSPVVRVIKYAMGGTGTVPNGYRCVGCGEGMTSKKMADQDIIRLAEQQIKDAQERLAQINGGASATKDKSTSEASLIE